MTALALPSDAFPSKESWREDLRPLAFELPSALAAREPPEARGLARDGVRLMVSWIADDAITHARFRDFPNFVEPGDVLVVNTSATINAALDAWRAPSSRAPGPDGELADRIELHLSSPVPEDDTRWVVELRRLAPRGGTTPLLDAHAGDQLALAAGASATLVEPFAAPGAREAGGRLWVAELAVPGDVMAFAAEYGSPIRYSYVRERWPLSYYQTIFATEPGSAEMPSAGRAFTREIVARLERKGVLVVPVTLHTGVASLESGEPPYPERYHVPPETADAVNRARAAGGRVIAVGTTVVRALETVAAAGGRARPGAGWTDLVVTPERGVYVVDALLTGFHEPKSSHLAMLAAVAGRRHLAVAYDAALRHHYLWHEFGDVHLIL
ncbi:MAG: S-adenosylmethionine:tRNA ribosyltransferase-isomerase [Gemmatimonadaceae bacterium]